MKDPLEFLDRKELLLGILQNIEIKITQDCRVEDYEKDGNLELKFWWDNTPNWSKVMTFITQNTIKGGSTSSYEMCSYLEIDPNGTTFYKKDQL